MLVGLAGCSAMHMRPPWLADGVTLEGEPEIGVAYKVEVGTHCGLTHVNFDGSEWAISGVLSDGSGNPPDGFNNPGDTGTITLTSDETAIWTSEFGQQRELTRDAPHPVIDICY